MGFSKDPKHVPKVSCLFILMKIINAWFSILSSESITVFSKDAMLVELIEALSPHACLGVFKRWVFSGAA